MCGNHPHLRPGSSRECDPAGDTPCCHEYKAVARCGNGPSVCTCKNCTDYRVVQDLRTSETNCTITRVGDFLKTVCSDVEDKTEYYFKCMNSNVSYTMHWKFTGKYFIKFKASGVCENDQYSYQSCVYRSQISDNKKTGRALCGGYHCLDKENKTQFRQSSKNYTVSKVCPTDGSDIEPHTTCDHRCDVWDCKDEIYCNGYHYGFECLEGEWNHVLADWMCDGANQSDCDFEESKDNCEVTNATLLTCIRSRTGRRVPILNYSRCAVLDFSRYFLPYCEDYSDQTNCSDVERIGGYCLINGYNSSVSIHAMCDSKYIYDDNHEHKHTQICDGGLENACITTSSGCKVQKHKMCDGVSDCSTRDDELDDTCELIINNFDCIRTFQINPSRSGNSKGFPMSWIMDGVRDCTNGDDERKESWSFCENITTNISSVVPSNEKCQNVYRCSGKNISVMFDVLCDGLESCGLNGNENTVCQIARDFPNIVRVIPASIQENPTRDLCATRNGSRCKMVWFTRPNDAVKVFGISKIRLKLNAPTSKVDCRNEFGEYYVYLSCLGLCLDNTSCPLLNNHLRHDSCIKQYPDRSYTLAENLYLTFAIRTDDNRFSQPNVFECNNRKCVNYSRVCDLINDCGDLSDEMNCTNHMICSNTINDTNRRQLIALSQRCDGLYDCFDLSDECNERCGKRSLGRMVLRIFCWCIGILAVGFNLFTVVNGVKQFGKCETDNMFMTRTFVSLIGYGDFLIGIYLVGLSIFDSFIFGNDFCTHQIKWFTGTGCVALGIISTIGSQLSLFTMTILSIDRMSGLIRNSIRMTPPGRVNKRVVLKAVLLTIGAVTISFAVALIPLAPSLEDYFVQGMHYDVDPNYKLFIGFPDKARHIRVLQEYHNTTKITADTTWKEIGQKVDEMFSQNHGTMNRTAVHFYGNDGICLFKFFVRRDDPRRSREVLQNFTDISDHKGDAMMWLILCLNFACFFVISVCYVIINVLNRRCSERSGASQNRNAVKKNRAVQNRITAIIATDFMCWVPLTIICALHNLKAIDATDWYVYFTMFVLPINSVINPILYDNTIKNMSYRSLQRATNVINRSKIAVSVRQIWQERETNRTEVTIEIRSVQTPAITQNECIVEDAQNDKAVQEKPADVASKGNHDQQRFQLLKVNVGTETGPRTDREEFTNTNV